MSPRISVIVPVYNMEVYLEACISSIINQTFTDLEIILINDGSMDCSGSICDQFQQLDHRIRVHHKANQGLSSARNTGIDLSTGEYLAFVDSDDTIKEDMLELLYQQITEKDADFVFCDYYRKEEIDSIPPMITGILESKLLNQKQLFEWLYLPEYCIILPVSWNKLYKKELFHNLRFPEGRYHEDEFLIHKIIAKTHKAVFLNAKLYGYLLRSNSIVGTGNLKMKKDILDALHDRTVFFQEQGNKEMYLRSLRFYIRKTIWECMKIKHTPKGSQFILLQAEKLRACTGRTLAIGLFSRIKYTLFTRFPIQYIYLKRGLYLKGR
jgi:glycosyltransferase involved in cell wall biosynthesis